MGKKWILDDGVWFGLKKKFSQHPHKVNAPRTARRRDTEEEFGTLGGVGAKKPQTKKRSGGLRGPFGVNSSLLLSPFLPSIDKSGTLFPSLDPSFIIFSFLIINRLFGDGRSLLNREGEINRSMPQYNRR